MNKIKQKWGFTLVELIVTATILVILTAVWFYSYSQSLVDTRDSVRTSDLADLTAKLKLYKQQRGAYPLPSDSFNILNRGILVAKQGQLSRSVALSTADSIQYDPYINIPYTYSITNNKQEFELSLTLENSDNNIAILGGTYKSVSKNVLPTITLALESTASIEINTASGGTADTNFIFNKGAHNLPYTFDGDFAPYSDGTALTDLLLDGSIEYYQNSDYRTCNEIYEAGKSISNGVTNEEYQILDGSGSLQDTNCTFS